MQAGSISRSRSKVRTVEKTEFILDYTVTKRYMIIRHVRIDHVRPVGVKNKP